MSDEPHYKRKGLFHGLLDIKQTQGAVYEHHSDLVMLRGEVPKPGLSPHGISSTQTSL